MSWDQNKYIFRMSWAKYLQNSWEKSKKSNCLVTAELQKIKRNATFWPFSPSWRNWPIYVHKTETVNKVHPGQVGKCFPVTKYLRRCLSVTVICHTSPNSPPLACQTWETVETECFSTLQKLIHFLWYRINHFIVVIFLWSKVVFIWHRSNSSTLTKLSIFHQQPI